MEKFSNTDKKNAQKLKENQPNYTNYSLLKLNCKILKYCGMGNFWYENVEMKYYKCYQSLIFLSYYFMTISEGLEIFMHSLPTELHGEATSLAGTHTTLLIRFHMLYYQMAKLKQLNREVVNVCEEFEKPHILRAQYKKVKLSVIVQMFPVYSTLTFYIVEGVRRVYLEDNVPFMCMITYWPLFEDRSYFALIVRIFIVFVIAEMLTAMMANDSLAIIHLIILSFKFVTLRNYFDDLLQYAESNIDTMNKNEFAKKFKEKFQAGIFMHRELIRISNKIYSTLGGIMSIQVCQGSAVVILVLVKLTLKSQTSDLALSAILSNVALISSCLIQLALYMWNAGEITYQASRISDAMFHCGWYLCEVEQSSHNDVRRLVLMGCAQAQRPVIMKAFGVQDLSYESYVAIVKTTYSIYAVFQ